MSEKFKISGVGIDTTHLVAEELHGEWGYIYSSLAANNEFLYASALKEDTVLVLGVDFLDELKTAIGYYVESIRRASINLLLIPGNHDFEKYGQDLRDLMIEGKVENIGLKHPRNLKDLKTGYEELEKLGIKAEYISLDICPYNFDYSIITWANENDVKILGFNPFGGNRNSGAMIESFTSPYLLGFISTYATIVFLSSRNQEFSRSSWEYIRSLYGKESTPKFMLRKTVKKLGAGYGEIISCSLKITDNFIAPIELPEYFYPYEDLKISYGNSIPDTEEFWSFDTNRIEDGGIAVFEELKKPEDGGDQDFLSIIRPRIIKYLQTIYQDLPFKQNKLGKCIYVIACSKVVTERKGWFGWIKKPKTEVEFYVLYYKSGRFLFRSLNFAEKKAQNSNM